MADVPDLEPDEVTTTELAVDAEMKRAISRTRFSICSRTRNA
jgi:hypothetical protein